jgi:hypothetical protein
LKWLNKNTIFRYKKTPEKSEFCLYQKISNVVGGFFTYSIENIYYTTKAYRLIWNWKVAIYNKTRLNGFKGFGQKN